MDETKREKQRFDLELWSNENIVSGYNFQIRSFNEGSMSSFDFVNACRECVAMIKAEMASKSRIATWVYDGPNYENLELLKLKQEYLDAHPEEHLAFPYKGSYVDTNYIAKERTWSESSDADTTIEPGTQVFKFVVKDRGNVVFEEIWDACVYPKVIRERVDLINNPTKYGDENEYVGFNSSLMMRTVRGRDNLCRKMAEHIASVCAPESVTFDKDTQEIVFRGKYAFRDDYTFSDEYKNVPVAGKEGGDNTSFKKTYNYGRYQRLNALGNHYMAWAPIQKKTKEYRKELADCGLIREGKAWQKKQKI